MSNVFELRDVSFAYPGREPALRNITLNVMPGEHLAMIGPNGSGKSTLLHIMAALQYPTGGTVAFEGEVLDRHRVENSKSFRKSYRSRVGVLFQNSDLQLFCSRVREEVAFGPLQTMPRDEALRRTDDIMRAFCIEELADEPPYALSGGEKRRVALAAVLVMQPDILLMDEPFANLDPRSADFLLDVLTGYIRDSAKTVVTTTHDLETARLLSTHCAVLAPDHTIACHALTETVINDDDLLLQVNLVSRRSVRLDSVGGRGV